MTHFSIKAYSKGSVWSRPGEVLLDLAIKQADEHYEAELLLGAQRHQVLLTVLNKQGEVVYERGDHRLR